MTVDELYGRYNDMLKGINVTPAQDFVFDLTDDNSQNSLKSAFPGIDALLMPECGNYLVVATVIEDPNCLMLLFPDQSDGSCALKAFNTGTKGYCDLTDPANGQEKLTIDNFKDFANMEDIARRFNEFVFCPGKGSPAEVKDIGSIDITHDEPVEIPTTTTTTTDDEENEMKFKPIQEDTELDRETKWVEIPNTNAGGVTVTEDDDPFAGEPGLDPNAPAPEGGDAAAAPADGGGDAAPVDATAETPAEGDAAAAPAEGDAAAPAADAGGEAAPAEGDAAGGTDTIDDPKAKMRELLAYYTNYMNELVQDPNTSTELISATQEMIDSLIKNMESADGIEEVKADSEEAAKEDVAVDEAPAEETPPAEGDAGAEATPAEGDAATAPEEAPVAESIKAKGIMGNIRKFFGAPGGYDTDDLSKATVDELADYVFASFPRLTEYEISDLFNKNENGYGFNMTLFKNQYDKVIRPQLEEKGADPTKLDAIPNEVRDRQSGIFNKLAGFLNSLVVKQKKGMNEADEILPIPVTEDTEEDEKIDDAPGGDDQAALDAKIDAEIDDLHKDDWEDIQPATSDDILTPGDINNSPVNDVDIGDVPPTPEEELATTEPDLATPAPTSDVLDDTALPSPEEEDDLLGTTDFAFGADGLPLDKFDGDVDALGDVPSSKKVSWSSDYATGGVATSDDNNVVVPEVLKELQDYYKKVSDEVSKVPGKEDALMKLQKIQVLSQTIQNEWNAILGQIGDTCASSYDRSNMGDLEKDELDTMDAFNQVGAGVMADDEKEEEDELAINDQIASFCESFKHLM